MPNNVIQSSFSAGEVAPSYQGRVDLAKYHAGLATMRNWFVDVRGGASTREGTEFIARAAISEYPVRVIPFQYSATQSYAIELGQHYARFYSDGGQILEANKTITGISNSGQAIVTSAGHGFNNSDTVVINSVSGMKQINGRSFIISLVTGNTFALNDLDGNPINSTNYNFYTGGGTASRVYTISTPWAANDLALLKYTQSNDVMTLTHIEYAAVDLKRLADANWTITAVTFAAGINPPTSSTATPAKTGDLTNYNYVITAVSATTGEESIASIPECTALNSKTMSQTVGAYVTVSWPAVSGAVRYRIYRQREVPGSNDSVGGLFGYVGTSTTTSFVDSNITPDFEQSPQIAQNPFASNNNPGCASYFQGRKYFAGSLLKPQTFYATQPDNYQNMNTSIITIDSDAITETLAAEENNAIQFLVPMNSLIALTTSGAWQITGNGQDASITPTSIRAVPQAYSGSSPQVKPLRINTDVLYVPFLGAGFFDLSYNYLLQNYNGDDISVLSSHLFFNHQILDMAWEETPLKRVWVIREDGIMLSLTYMKNQDVNGWARHDTQGYFRSVCTIPENNKNSTYVVVERLTPSGGYVKYIERLASRTITDDVNLAWCVDAGLQYAYILGELQCTPSDVTGTITLTVAGGNQWNANYVGTNVRINGGKAVITNYISPTKVTANVIKNLTTVYPASAGDWSFISPTITVSGLDHLNGLYVTGLADGGVIPLTQVANGSITLDHSATDIIIGLPYTCDIETLPLDTGEPTIAGKRKNMHAMTLRVVNTRGLEWGPDENNLTPIAERTPEDFLGSPIPLQTTDERINISPSWQRRGSLFIRQANPLPATITALVPEVIVGDTTGDR